MVPIRLGLIGLGWIGETHAKCAIQLGCEGIVSCDSDPAKEVIAQKLGIPFYRDYREMLKKETIDGVVISLPNELHESVGTYCAERGLHILIEKPIAHTVESAERIIGSTKKHNVKLLVGHYRRFNPKVVEARRLVQEGELGKIIGVSVLWCVYKDDTYFSIPWRIQKGAGPILINGIHEIDTLRFILGEIERVFSEVSNTTRKFEVEDTASITVRFAKGAVGTIFISDTVPSLWAYEYGAGENPFFNRTNEDSYYFFGTKAALTVPRMRKVYYPDPLKIGWQYPTKVVTVDVPESDPYILQLQHFCNVIKGTEEPRTSGEDALKTLRVVHAILESGKKKLPVTVP